MTWLESVKSQVSSLNISTGGDQIRYQPVKVPKADKPLLVIGLGGTGLRIGRQIKDMFIERFKPATNPRAGVDERLPENTFFLGIDTDNADLDMLGYIGNERCEIGDPSLATKLLPRNRDLLPSYITDWLNPGLISLGGTGVDGAQGVRQIGRFDLFTKINNVIGAISNGLQMVQGGLGNIQVLIAAGVAGGTGAGTFLDMPYLVRYVANQLALSGRLSIMGILVTPDVYAAMDGATAGIKRANGYAGLKELDYWMEAVNRRDNFEQQYSPTVSVKWDVAPFDDCILISSQTVAGRAPTDAYSILRGVVAEYITNAFAEEQRDLTKIHSANADYGFMHSSFRDNVRNNLAPLPQKFDVSRRYTVIGASNGQIPLQEMILRESVFLFDKVAEYYDVTHAPDMHDENVYKDFVEKVVGNSVKELFASINARPARESLISEMRNSDRLAPHSPDIDQTVKAYMNALESRSLGTDAINLITERVRMMEQKLIAMFCNTQTGPFYASRFIDATPGEYNVVEKDFDPNLPHNYDLKSVLESKRKEAQTKRNQANETYVTQTGLANDLYREIKTDLIAPRQKGLFWANKADEYYTHCDTANQEKRTYYEQDTLCRLYDAMLEKLEHLSKQIFKPLCKTLLELSRTHKEIDLYMGTPNYRLSQNRYFSEIVDPAVLLNDFKNNYMTVVRTDRLVESLFQDMMRPYIFDSNYGRYNDVASKEKWLVTDPQHDTTINVNIRDNLQRVVNNFFREYNGNTLLEFWKLQYPTSMNPDGTLNLPAIVATLGPKMSTAAAPMFLKDSVYPIDDGAATTLSAEYITIPQNAVGLETALNPTALKVVKKSAVADRMFWVRSLDGVSLYHYGALKECENDYIQYAIRGRHIGSHLWETSKMDWSKLPNPLPRAARPVGYNNEVQMARDEYMIERITTLLDRQEYPNLVYDPATNNLTLYFHNDKFRHNLDALCQQVQERTITPQNAAVTLNNLFNLRDISTLNIDHSILTNSYQNHDEPQKDLVCDVMMQRPAIVDALEKDIADSSEAIGLIKEYIESGTADERLLDMADRMVDLLCFNVLKRDDMIVTYSYGGQAPVVIYDTMKDNATYANRFHAAYAFDVCLAAKLIDLENPDHDEHGLLVQLKELEDDLNNDLAGANMERRRFHKDAFMVNAPVMKRRLELAKSNLTLTSAHALNMAASDKTLCEDFVKRMLRKIDEKALNFGVAL